MRTTVLTAFALLALAVAALAAQTDPLAGVARITLDDAKKLLAAGKAVVVDVRSLESYKAGHIPGSVCIPTYETSEKGKSLPKDKTIITYCS